MRDRHTQFQKCLHVMYLTLLSEFNQNCNMLTIFVILQNVKCQANSLSSSQTVTWKRERERGKKGDKHGKHTFTGFYLHIPGNVEVKVFEAENTKTIQQRMFCTLKIYSQKQSLLIVLYQLNPAICNIQTGRTAVQMTRIMTFF